MKSLLLLLSIFFSAAIAQANMKLSHLPIQDGGRIKPFDTFAKESLELIYGKQKFEGKLASEVVFTWVLQPAAWEEKQLVEIRHHFVKKGLGLDEKRKYFSIKEIMLSERLSSLIQELNSRKEKKERLDPGFQALDRLQSQVGLFREIASGRAMRLVPRAGTDQWDNLLEMSEPYQSGFMEVTKSFIASLGKNDAEAEQRLSNALTQWQELARQANAAFYADPVKINREVHLNTFHPFQKAWIFYLLATLSLIFVWVFKKDSFYKFGWIFTALGLALHIYGFALRVYLAERAPVTNMYETVVWVALGSVVFAMIIEAIYRWRFILLAGSAVGVFCLVLADLAPTVLDPSLHPLEPVLRDNFWLTVHVLTITISYAAFFLAFALGDVGLFYFLKDENKFAAKINAINLAIYRSIQIGVGLLAPGIILGGIWADYSWGRFWGWDPKETWALIALLGYIAVLHARLAGILKNYGMIASAVLTFSLVIMAWYGVNFVLGAGLHSYGFGAGGVEYVAAFVALHIIYVVFVTLVRRERAKQLKNKAN